MATVEVVLLPDQPSAASSLSHCERCLTSQFPLFFNRIRSDFFFFFSFVSPNEVRDVYSSSAYVTPLPRLKNVRGLCDFPAVGPISMI